jgi:protein subunit release factor A
LTSRESAHARPALQEQAADPTLWDDPAKGRRITSELSRLTTVVDRFDRLQSRLDDVIAMDELLADADDPKLASELATSVTSLEEDLEAVELEALLSGPYDANDAIATVQAGAGGTESMDWADMLLRMFFRWAERHSSPSSSTRSITATRRASSRRPSPCTGTTPTGCCRRSAASIGWFGSARSMRRSVARRVSRRST